VGLALVFAVALEGAVRVEDLLRYGTPLVSPFHEQAQLIVRDADGMHGRPNARYRKWILNRHGMRGPDATEAKTPGTFRLITAGASETFGLYESAAHDYPRLLEGALEAMRRDGRCRCDGVARFEVLNGALLGMTLPTVVQDVRNRLKRFAPDVILLYPTPPQYLGDDPPVAARPDPAVRPDAVLLADLLYPRVLDRLREQAKTVLPGPAKDWLRRREIASALAAHPAQWRFQSPPADRLALFEADLRDALVAIRGAGATPMLASHANAFPPAAPRDPVLLNQWARFYPRADGDVIVDFDEAASLRIARLALHAGGPNAVQQPAERGPGLFQDFAHFNDKGAALAAQTLADSLTAWIDRTGKYALQ